MRFTLITAMKVLCVAEKNSIAKSVANALGGGSVRVRSSPDKFIKNYDLSFNFPNWGPCEVTITAVRGHLTDLEFPSEYKNWDNPPPRVLFDAPVSIFIGNGMKNAESNIKKEARNSQKLFIWTDCDREGEHIGHEIITVAKSSNRSLRDPDIKRANFNNVDPSHLRNAALHPQDLDMNQVNAVEARREFDLRTGFAFTRFQTTALKRALPVLAGEKPISYGSCQFPTLGFVVDRYNKVKNFIPEPFWYIELKAKCANGTILTPTWDRHRLFDRLAVLVIYEKLLGGEKLAKVIKLVKKPTSKWRPLPLTTVELQKLGSNYLKISSKKVMDIAESLYNLGYISYPRTETNFFDDAIDLKNLVSKHTDARGWGDYAKNLLEERFQAPRKGKNNDKAHPPIHPIKGGLESEMKDSAHWKVYEFITRHFLACCSDDAKGIATQVTFDWNGETFSASGVIVTERNFLDVYPYQKWTDSELPDLREGDRLPITSALMKDGKTSPPNYLTEPDLIALMDANGIGTDATMAEHIEKVLTREYIIKHKGRGKAQTYLVPSNLGMALYEAYDQIGLDLALTKPFLRKETEEMMNQISRGAMTKVQFLSQSLDKYKRVFDLVDQQKQVLISTARRYLSGDDS